MTNAVEMSRRLQAAGAEPKLADAIAESQTALVDGAAATKPDLAELRTVFGKLEGELTLVKWMLGTNLLLTFGVLWSLLRRP